MDAKNEWKNTLSNILSLIMMFAENTNIFCSIFSTFMHRGNEAGVYQGRLIEVVKVAFIYKLL